MKWIFLMCVVLLLVVPMGVFAAVKTIEGKEGEEKALTVGANLDARVNYEPELEKGSYYYSDSKIWFRFAPTDGLNTIYWEFRPAGENSVCIKRAYIETDLAKALKMEKVSLKHRIGRQTVESYDYSFTDSGFELFEPSYTQNAAMATMGYGPFTTRAAFLAYPDAIAMGEVSYDGAKVLYHAEVGVWHQSHIDNQVVANISGGGAGFTVGAGLLRSENADLAYGGALKYELKGAYVAGALNSLDQWDVNAGYSHEGKAGFDVSCYNDGFNTSVKPWVWIKAGKAKYRLVYDTFPKKATFRVNYDF
jgi:hypothetical protein